MESASGAGLRALVQKVTRLNSVQLKRVPVWWASLVKSTYEYCHMDSVPVLTQYNTKQRFS